MEKQRTILIADDRPEIRTLVRITLTSDGFNVAECKNAQEAVSLAKTLAPHLIIMDIDMPGKYNGITATSMLTADPQTANIPIIMLTALKGAAKECLDSGASAYLTKPFSPIDLLKNVQQFARNK
ncbi:response regulator [Halodesulfovibrio marinisediminis]|uniref:Response regulator receiver domain-containing protein n=1 Tax=Halodesulfovibrio marinisediminis DSM 17456 TaxID=1121457 RepID=A0A1N6H8T2_9BACT|nr:response regulator [Halodesulfovibrio marinisediminis]SIO16173.1 Response regulator receiver domain-containing protein [Halodesulfovibrio marinisediminis DSM 17456]